MVKGVIKFFDTLEDNVRIALSHRPILYSFIGAVGIILLWKGVWETAELFPILFGPVSILLGVVILLITGLLVSFFIGDRVILSGLTREKKLVEKTESEVRAERAAEERMAEELKHIEADLHALEKKIEQ